MRYVSFLNSRIPPLSLFPQFSVSLLSYSLLLLLASYSLLLLASYSLLLLASYSLLLLLASYSLAPAPSRFLRSLLVPWSLPIAPTLTTRCSLSLLGDCTSSICHHSEVCICLFFYFSIFSRLNAFIACLTRVRFPLI